MERRILSPRINCLPAMSRLEIERLFSGLHEQQLAKLHREIAAMLNELDRMNEEKIGEQEQVDL